MPATHLLQLLETLDASAREPLARQRSLVEQSRPLFMSQRDPLLKARFLLRAAQVRDTCRPLGQSLAEQLLALRIFRANNAQAEQALCLAALSHWHYLAGHELASQHAGMLAMQCADLPLNARMALLRPLCLCLASQLRIGDAWALLQDLAPAPRLAACAEDTRQRIDALRTMLHLIETQRALALPSLYGLDTVANTPDPRRAQEHLDAARELMPTLQRLASPDVLTQVRIQFHHAGSVHAALRHDPPGVRAHIAAAHRLADDGFTHAVFTHDHGLCARLLGDALLASRCQNDALRALRPLGLTRPLLMALFELAQAHALADNPHAAHASLMEFIQVRAHLQCEDQASLAALRAVFDDAAAPAVCRPPPQPSAMRADATHPPEASLRGTEPPCLARAERLLLQHLPRRLGPTALARQTGVSLRTLQHAARSYRGTTLTDMRRELLMREALRLISDTGMSLRDIATRCGYRDASAFSRDFKRVHGSAPSQHRETLRSAAAAGHVVGRVEVDLPAGLARGRD